MKKNAGIAFIGKIMAANLFFCGLEAQNLNSRRPKNHP